MIFDKEDSMFALFSCNDCGGQFIAGTGSEDEAGAMYCPYCGVQDIKFIREA